YALAWTTLTQVRYPMKVLEPERPTRDAVLRRIAIGNHSSMQIDLDPLNPKGVPEVRFLGADSVISPLRDRLNQQLASWDPAALPRHNLQRILQIEFPSRKASELEEMSVECAICYTYRLDGVLPDVVCDNPRCARPFHGSCLYEWLRSVPASRHSLNPKP
ncbi:WD-repeat region-domain-containing protein, partial [Baffinella frigidus]